MAAGFARRKRSPRRRLRLSKHRHEGLPNGLASFATRPLGGPRVKEHSVTVCKKLRHLARARYDGAQHQRAKWLSTRAAQRRTFSIAVPWARRQSLQLCRKILQPLP